MLIDRIKLKDLMEMVETLDNFSILIRMDKGPVKKLKCVKLNVELDELT